MTTQQTSHFCSVSPRGYFHYHRAKRCLALARAHTLEDAPYIFSKIRPERAAHLHQRAALRYHKLFSLHFTIYEELYQQYTKLTN